jgi:hypothetical protein
MKLAVNDRISWKSAAGNLTGTIDNIVLSENGKNETVAWLDVAIDNRKSSTRLCAVDMNLTMLSVEKIQH